MDMNKKISISGKKNALPQKRTMNLYVDEKTVNSPSVVIAVGVVVAVFIALFAKFAIIDRYAKLDAFRAEVNEVQQQLTLMQNKLAGFDEVQDQYRRYTDHYKTEEEASLVDRGDIIEIIEKNVMTVGKCPSINVKGNSVSIVVQVEALEEVATIRENLEACGRAKNVTVYTADWSESNVYESYFDELETVEAVNYVQASICFEATEGEEAAK